MDDHVAPWTSWVFTALTALMLILMLTLSFLRFRRKRQRKREKEQEYIAQFRSILPGFNYREMKKTLARKILTNTHNVSVEETCASPIPEPIISPEINEHLEPSVKTEYHARDVFSTGASGQNQTEITSPNDINRRLMPSQNSGDTTTDEEKPLVGGGDLAGRFTMKTVRDRYNRLKGYSPRLGKTAEHVLHEKRKQKLQSGSKERSLGKDFSIRSNFTSTSIEFEDEHRQNYILYSTNSSDKRGLSEPDVYTFPPLADTESYSTSAPAVAAVDDYYIETDTPAPKHKTKHSKAHRVDRHGRKKQRKLTDHRARSLPHLDDVYYGNLIDETKHRGDNRQSHDLERQRPATAKNTERLFIKRKQLMSQSATIQPDNAAPLLKMRSFPVISQSEESLEASLDKTAFVSEYM